MSKQEGLLALAELRQLVEDRDRAIAQRDMLVEALEGLYELHARPDEDRFDAYERIAESFYREVGMLAPGKDQSAALGGTPTYEERTEAYNAWLKARVDAAVAALASVKGAQ